MKLLKFVSILILYTYSALFTFSEQFSDKNNTPLKISFINPSSPFYFFDENKQEQGFLVDYIKLIASKKNHSLDFNETSYDSIAEVLNNENSDIYLSLDKPNEHPNEFEVLEPFIKTPGYIYFHQSIRDISNSSTLNAFIVGLVKGSGAHKEFKKNPKLFNNVKLYKSYDSLMNALKNNELLVFASDEISAEYYLNLFTLSDFFEHNENSKLFEIQQYLIVKKNNKHKLNNFLENSKSVNKQEIENIYNKWIQQSDKTSETYLTIALPENYEPFSSLSDNKLLQGLLVDYWLLWAKKSNKKIKFTPYKNSLNPLSFSRIDADIYSGFLFKDSLKKNLKFSNQIYKVEVGVFVKKNNYYSNISDLENIKLGVIKNTFNSDYLIKNFPNIQTLEYDSLNLLYRDFLNNRIDGVFHDTFAMKQLLGEDLGSSYYQLESFKISKSLFAAVSEDSQHLISAINKGLEKISNNEINAIVDEWIPNIDGRVFSNFTYEEKEWLNKNPLITIGLIKDYFPFEFIDENNKLQGLSLDIFKSISENIGLNFRFKFFEKKNINSLLDNNNIDLILSEVNLNNKNNNENFISYSRSQAAVASLSPYILSIDNLNGKKVAINKNSPLYYFVLDNFSQIKLEAVSSFEEGFELVSDGKVEAYIDSYDFLNSFVNYSEIKDFSINKIQGLPEFNTGFKVSSKNKILSSLLHKQLKLISLEEKNKYIFEHLAKTPNIKGKSLSISELNWLQENQVVDIAVLKDNPPYSFYENNFFQGLIIDYLSLIEKKLNIHFHYIPVGSYDEIYSDKKINLIAELPKNKTYTDKFEASKVYSISDLILIHNEKKSPITSLKSQKSIRILIPEAYSLERELIRKFPNLTIISINSVKLGLEMLERNKADVMLVDKAALDYFLDNNLHFFIQNEFEDFVYDLSLGFRKNSNIKIQIFEKALANISDLEKETIRRKWFRNIIEIENYNEAFQKFMIFAVILSIIPLIAILFWNKRLKNEINNRKSVEENLLKISQAIEQNPSAIVITDSDFEIEYLNEAFSTLTGWLLADLINQQPPFLVAFNEIRRTLHKGSVWSKEKKIVIFDNSEIWVRITISSIYSKEIISNFVLNIDNITEEKRIEELKAHQAERERLFADISTHLIIHSMKEIDSEIEYGLKKIGEFSNVDRGYLFLISPDKRLIYNTHEWRAEGVKSQLDTLKGLFPFPWFMDQLKDFKNIHIPSVPKLEEESGIVREVLMSENIKSLLFVPIRYSHELLGFVGFDTFKKEKIWTKEDIAVLKIFGDIFANALARKNIENKLKEAKKRADSANRAKSNFLANMSHEIRTPMNAILGITHLLSQTILNKKQTDYVEKVKQSANNLLNIINDILDFSKIEAGKIEFEEIEFNLNKVLENLANIISVKAQNKNIEIIIRKSVDVPEYLIGDALRLGQILLNLTSNSVKFTDKGEVMIIVETIEESDNNIILAFSIRDTGIGIEKEKLTNLFESFIQADTSTTRKYGGTGLGLSISKKLVEMMNGTIKAESTVGEGSTFYFSAKFKKSSRVKTNYILPSIDLRNISALILDSNKSAAETLKLYLESFSFDVDITYDRKSALNMASKKEYKLVLMDSECSIKGCEKFINSFNETLPLDSNTKFILTEKYSPDFSIDTENSSFDDIITKPITQSSIFNSIINVLGIQSPGFIKNQKNKLNDSIQFIKGSRILLVEDNEINQQVAIEILQKKGFWIDVANNGQEAINKLITVNKEKYDIILMDLQMPVLDGYETTRAIRNKLHIDDIPIIAMTADALKGVEKQCLEVGMNDYISKPIIPDNLFKKLNKWMKKEVNLEISPNSTEEILARDTHLDVAAGIKRIGNNKSLYLSLINKFYHNNLGLTANINKLFHKKEVAELKEVLHTLKGVSGNISANHLHKLCFVAETSINEDFDSSDSTLMNVINELNTVLSVIKEILASEVNQIAKSNEYSKQEIELSFRKLIKLLSEDDIDALDYFEVILSKVKSQPFYKELSKLKNFIHNYEFEQAIKELHIFFKKHNFLKGE